GTPYLSWFKYGANYDLGVSTWNGSAWIRMGQTSLSAASEATAGVETGPQGTFAFVRTKDTSGAREFWVHRWTGVAWEPLGGGPVVKPAGTEPQHTLDRDGWPVVATSAGSVTVQRWNGSAWSSLPTPSTAGTVQSIVVDADNRPVVGIGNSFIERFDGVAWESLGSLPPSGLKLAAGVDGRLFIAFYYGTIGLSDFRTRVLEWIDGDGWKALGVALTTVGDPTFGDTPVPVINGAGLMVGVPGEGNIRGWSW
ncbi:MAG: hypothetical protein KC492_00015, partial [Myxococcales bacterium]|nr:hypothetical protein [Myxococcales bacterium]